MKIVDLLQNGLISTEDLTEVTKWRKLIDSFVDDYPEYQRRSDKPNIQVWRVTVGPFTMDRTLSTTVDGPSERYIVSIVAQEHDLMVLDAAATDKDITGVFSFRRGAWLNQMNWLTEHMKKLAAHEMKKRLELVRPNYEPVDDDAVFKKVFD